MSLENKYFVASFFILFIVLFSIIYVYGSAHTTPTGRRTQRVQRTEKDKKEKKEQDEGKRLCISAIISIVASLFMVGLVYGYFYYRQHHLKVYLDGGFYD